MRPVLSTLVFLLLISTQPLKAQTTFAPPGAEWYHTMAMTGDGVFHSYYVGDTTILGINCRAILEEANTMPSLYAMGLHVQNLLTLYVYNTADTIFMYNYLFKRFTPLYVFNVNDGDTITLPVFPPDPMILNNAGTDSVFRFVVDSVRMRLYDTATLKTVYTRSLGYYAPYSFGSGTPPQYVYSYGATDTVGSYAEQIGSIHTGLLPWCLKCGGLADEALQPAADLRCYDDPAYSIHLISGNCSNPPTAITPVNKTKAINIFPTPASDEINIRTSLQKNMSISIVDMNGKEVLSQENNYNTTIVNVAQLPQGIYLLKIFIDNDAPVYKRISIVH